TPPPVGAAAAATPGALSRPKHRPTRLAQRRGMALPKTGPSETWMSTTDEAPWMGSRRVPAWARPFHGAPLVRERLLRAQGALLRGSALGVVAGGVAGVDLAGAADAGVRALLLLEPVRHPAGGARD